MFEEKDRPRYKEERFAFCSASESESCHIWWTFLKQGLGKALPNKYLTEGTKNADADFCGTGRYLLSLLSRTLFALIQNPFFVNVQKLFRLLQLTVQKQSSKVTLRNQEWFCPRQHSKRNYTLILYLLPCKAAWSRIRFTQPIVTIKEAKPWQ